MDENKEMISYFAHEGEMARMERHVKRWFIGWMITFAALILTNIGWLIYESQFEDVTTTVEQEVSSEGGGNAVLNGDNAGAVYYGESEAKNNNKN